MQLYDMHTHILPAFDDGAKTVEDSLALIECLKKQGVSHICLTPHFYTHEMSVEDYVARRRLRCSVRSFPPTSKSCSAARYM